VPHARLETSFTRLLDLRLPVVQGGMVWCAGARLAAAVSEAGGLGLIGAGSMDADLLRRHIHKARTLTQRPFGVNVPLLFRHAEALLEVALEEGVRVFFTSAGSPRKVVPRLKAAGAVVFHVVSHPDLARKCHDAGVDGVVAEGFEAGGHDGREELTTLALLPLVVDAVPLPVLAAGGIVDGRGLAAALALGAAGVQMGTRFVACRESSAHPAFQQAVIDSPCDATRLVLKRGIPVRLLRNALRERIEAAEARSAPLEELLSILGQGRARLGMFEGDLEEGELEIGMGLGAIRDLPSAAEILTRLRSEYERARVSLPALLPEPPERAVAGS